MAQLLEPLAQRLGAAPALVDERGSTSWTEFNERVNRLMSALTRAGLTGVGHLTAFAHLFFTQASPKAEVAAKSLILHAKHLPWQ